MNSARTIAAGALLALTAVAAVPAQAATYTWDAPGYGWRTITDGHEYSSPRGTFAVTDGGDGRAFASVHGARGGGRGTLGYPVSNSVAQSFDHTVAEGWGYAVEGAYQQFERGVVYGTSAIDYSEETGFLGTYVVKGGAFGDIHARTGGGTGDIGYPIADEVRQAPGFWYQEFIGGTIYVSPSGAFPVYDYWGGWDHLAAGGGGGTLGYPTGHPVIQGINYGYQTFERGIMYSSPGCSACDTPPVGVIVKGGFVAAHAARGGGTGSLGYPKIAESYNASTRTWTQIFERGRIEIGPNGTRYVMGTFWEW